MLNINNHKGVIIIGNGIAGNYAADTIRIYDRDISITIITDEDYPLYSPCVLPHYLSQEIDEKTLFLKKRQDYKNSNIHFLAGKRVTDIDPDQKSVKIENHHLSYDKLIIATGSRPLIPPINGSNLKKVFCLKSVKDVEGIRESRGKSAAIVGTGLVGIEAAVALRERGCEVYLIELLERIMPKNFNSPASAIIREVLESRGIRVMTGERVMEILGEDSVEGLKTDRRTIDCDMVIMAAGMRPNIELARNAGIELGKNGGIKTGLHMQTNLPHIYACGDCVESPDIINATHNLNLLWGFAKKQGEVAGLNSIGIKRKYFADLPSVGTRLFDTAIASIGCTANEDTDDYRIIEKRGHDYFSSVILRNEVIIGAQMIGEVGLTGLFSYFIRKRLRLEEAKTILSNSKISNPVLYKIKHLL